jgi:Ca2+-binding RTX toxin-like protein
MSFAEPLEPRHLLSGVSFDGQFLSIEGTARRDRVHLSTDAGGLSVRVTLNGHVTLFPTRSISSVRISTGAGDDRIRADADFPLALGVDCGTGDDTVRGGSLADRIDGGPGDDALSGGGGADVVRGGSGSDTLSGGAGADALLGQGGIDSFELDSLDEVDNPDSKRDRNQHRRDRREQFDFYRDDDDDDDWFFFVSFNSGLTGGGFGWSGFFSF